MTRRQCIPARLDQYLNHDPRLIFKARLVFKARLLFQEIRYTRRILSFLYNFIMTFCGKKTLLVLVSDIAIFVLKRDVKLQLTTLPALIFNRRSPQLRSLFDRNHLGLARKMLVKTVE